MAAQVGRPKLDIDPRLVETLAGIGCTLSEIAAACNCHKDTISDNFSSELAKGRESGKTRLRKKQLEVALSGNVTMLIWLGKQILDQSDRTQIGGMEGNPIKTEFALAPETVAVVTGYAMTLRDRIKEKAEIAGRN